MALGWTKVDQSTYKAFLLVEVEGGGSADYNDLM